MATTAAEPHRRLSPPWLAAALLLAALLLHAATVGTAAPLGQAPLAGALLAAGGAGWVAWALWSLRAAGTPPGLHAVPQVLVEEGPYRYGRHPVYLGTTVTLLGAALALGVPALAAGAAAYAWVVQKVHIPYEESRLRARFGGWYSDYAAQVRRWL